MRRKYNPKKMRQYSEKFQIFREYCGNIVNGAYWRNIILTYYKINCSSPFLAVFLLFTCSASCVARRLTLVLGSIKKIHSLTKPKLLFLTITMQDASINSRKPNARPKLDGQQLKGRWSYFSAWHFENTVKTISVESNLLLIRSWFFQILDLKEV